RLRYAPAGTRAAVIALALGALVNAAAIVMHARGAPRNSISVAGLPAPLVAKVREITNACGSRVVSTWRRGARVWGGSVSNHARWRAADLVGNPRCIYPLLANWPGGYSTDYHDVRCRTARGWVRCPHVHLSWNPGGMEWGKRFAHRGGRKHGARKAYRRAAHHRVSDSPQPVLW
ncbi:MAG TPA: hypothetical protein VIH40_05650, partial [Xanthobacteraceae bacterium]